MDKFWSWLFVALFIGVVVWRRSHKREMLLGANEITPILTEKVCLKIDQNTFDKKVLPYWAVEGIRPMKAVERTMRYVFDQARISWFHWGFFIQSR